MIPVSIPVAISVGEGRTKWAIASISSIAVDVPAKPIPITSVMTNGSAYLPVLNTSVMSVVVIPVMVMISFNSRSDGQYCRSDNSDAGHGVHHHRFDGDRENT